MPVRQTTAKERGRMKHRPVLGQPPSRKAGLRKRADKRQKGNLHPYSYGE